MNDTKTPASCSRIQNSTRFASPLHKAPLSTSKVPQASKIASANKMVSVILLSSGEKVHFKWLNIIVWMLGGDGANITQMMGIQGSWPC